MKTLVILAMPLMLALTVGATSATKSNVKANTVSNDSNSCCKPGAACCIFQLSCCK